MPNWCTNELTITGDFKELKRFKEHAKGPDGGDLDFNKFIPYPKKYREMDEEKQKLEAQISSMPLTQREMFYKLNGELPKDGYNSGGYEWCISHWGTKWNACHSSMEFGDTLFYAFDTAWSPPLPVILAMSKQFPKLHFSLDYSEEGNGFEGSYECQDGQVTMEEDREITLTDEEEQGTETT